MTIRATKFTPEVLLSAPRRSPGLPNSDGSKILYSVSTYSFSKHSKKSEIRLLDVDKQETITVTSDSGAGDVKWLDDDLIVVLFSKEDGTTSVTVGKPTNFSDSNYTAGTIEGPVGDLKVISLDNGDYAFAVSGKADPDGKLVNPQKAKKRHTTGRLYNSMFVRHWDHYVTENKNSIWLSKLAKDDKGKFKLGKVRNALKSTTLESPIDPFGGTDHFDIGPIGLVYTSKDPELDPALHTKTNIYLLSANDFWEDSTSEASSTPIKINIDGFEGASTNPVFSPKGTSFAFLSMKTDGYESDKNQIFIVPDVQNPSWVIQALPSKDGKGLWDRSPSSIIWSYDGSSPLYLLAEDHGRGCLFASNWQGPGLTEPKMVVKGGAISDVRPLKNGELFISSSSLIDSSLYSVLPANGHAGEHVLSLPHDDQQTNTTRYLSSQTRNGSTFGLKRRQIDEIHWPGAAENTSVQAWVVKPSDFSSDKKYPLAYLIHGGPQGAWEDSWSTRWNPAVFAEQGYVVVTPNPTGSTGFGQDFTDAIKGQWGGLPYEDLVKGFDWIKENLDFVDTNRAVALGASYGGFMMNWIQGHPLGRKFKALVTHDGVFSMTGQLASEELYFPFHDFEKPLWLNREGWDKWDPSKFVENWSTPHLIIHSELDYRLTISEGLAAFHTLQARNVESQFLTFPDENHWVLKPENSLLWHRTVLDFINEKAGLPKYSDTMTEEAKAALE
ncbi:dipeptidyl-peptidase 5 precursor [Aaosphaeria arxii CBS 175.79]|uniref:Dipeptidyl-peptidase V n=1 Tax=Aaosphaeria arxii CBS 175.79 TaxID=1450172 RepID=A0A6A5XLM3_9PLEO|nr:dipeptidyl-peptidase 5 precursor [Aaosphaeria arxii CBS 175.79]KAF2013204.1 dipeptidyl-peptidase 5 precursor [Aaosphaeria arxii CBS 175.79]